MKRWIVSGAAAASLLAAGLIGASAQAQISAGNEPVFITADELEVIDAQRLQIWRDRVEMLQGQNRLRANLMNVYHAPAAGPARDSAQPGSGFGDVQRVEAIGDVYFVTPTETVRGDRAVYTLETDTIVVTGRVVLNQGENVLEGDQLTIKVGQGVTTMDAGPGGGPAGRVRGVFYPEARPQQNSGR